MRILVHDFGAYPFPLQLSRTLARRGEEVYHVCFNTLPTSRSNLDVPAGAPEGFHLRALEVERTYEKSSYWKRYLWEKRYGVLLARQIRAIDPDVTLSADTPIVAQARATRACAELECRFIYWLQDIRSVAAARILKRHIPFLGRLAGWWFLRLQRCLLRRSDDVVMISDDFRPRLREWGVDDDKLHVIPNWAPLPELPSRARDNAWAREMGLVGKKVLLYAGTLGMKHRPELFVRLCEHFDSSELTSIVVVAEGEGADWLRKHKVELGLSNLLIEGFQPYDVLPDVLASADILLGALLPAASEFSVPSKILTYLCAGRPILLSMPEDNLAAKTVLDAGAGRVVPPGDPADFVSAARDLLNDPETRRTMGQNARAHAEKKFDIDSITDRFEAILKED